MSFGKWYEETKSADGQSNANESVMTLPLFLSVQAASVPPDFGWNSIKSGLEAQMPQQILGMNYQQRFRVFCALLFLSCIFFGLGLTVGLPMITVRPQKFALSFTFGSITFMGSFAILRGPQAHMAGMFSEDRIIFTICYVMSMVLTLYFTFSAHGIKGFITVITCSILQMVTLIWYLITFLPGGAQGMKILMSTMVTMIRPFMVGCGKCMSSLVSRVFGI